MFVFISRSATVRSHFCLGLIFYGIAGILIGFREFLPAWLANVVANMLVGISIVMIHRGTCLMLSKRPPDMIYIISVLGLGCAYYQFTYISPNVGARLLIISMFRVPYFISAALAISRSSEYSRLLGSKALVYILFASSTWFILRGSIAISSHEWAIFLRTGPFQGINFLVASVANLITAIALSHVEAEHAINRTTELAKLLEAQSNSLEATVKAQTVDLRNEVVERKQAQHELQAEHQRLRLSEQRFFRTFDQAPIGASIISLEGRYLRVNREFENITGYSQAELQNLTVLDITHPDDQAESALSAQRLLDNEVEVCEEIKRYVTKDQQPVWVQVSVRIIRGDDGEPLFFLPMAIDITEKRNIELALHAAKERAEQTLEDLLVTQNSLIHAEKMASLGRLVSGAAHEINTPLGVAVTIGTLLSDQFCSLAKSFRAGQIRRTEMVSYIENAEEGYNLLITNLHRSADLVQSLKHVTSDQASEARRAFDLEDCISDTVISIGPIWRRPGHRAEVTCQSPISINGYPGVISQIVINLITNSVVHAFEANQAGHISITADMMDQGVVRLRYSDDGRGIDHQVRDKIFEPFFTTRRGSGSTGLGLHIVYNLVVGSLGGSIGISDNDPSGVVFTILFPCN